MFSCSILGQDVTLYSQLNGKLDFTFIGNTMNLVENNTIEDQCTALTQSSAGLELARQDEIVRAYLYWAGSGEGDLEILLNGNIIVPERNFTQTLPSTGLPFFSAFADVTSLVIENGNGIYEVSEFDISDAISEINYCSNGTNFAGWAIVVIYKNDSLPVNQINIYDGLQRVPTVLNIALNSLNVIDTLGAKIGFVAWEGDQGLANNETLRFNGNIISNPPLNPANNAFNGTNSATGSSTLYNMDLDIYDIQDNILPGDQDAIINLTSGADFVMINVVITKLNNEAPDATITINNVIGLSCNSRQVTIDYTVNNFDSFDVLPAGIPIAIYTGNLLIGQTQTVGQIAIGGSESGQITVVIPDSVPANFDIRFSVDDLGNSVGIESEILENNNNAVQNILLLQSPLFNALPNLFACVSDIQAIAFDFSGYATLAAVNPADAVSFYTSAKDANSELNQIVDLTNFIVFSASTTIYVRIESATCFAITSFELKLILFPEIKLLGPLFTCRDSQSTTFDFTNYALEVLINTTDTVSFFETFDHASTNTNPILSISNYLPLTTPRQIFVRVFNGFCYTITDFTIDFYELPRFNNLPTLISCNQGLSAGTFNFMNYDDLVKVDPLDTAVFYENLNDAENQTNPIISSSNYSTQTTPKEIFIRLENSRNCSSITSFLLTTKNCPPQVFNFISANGDDLNPTFFIEGLRDVFLNFKIDIFNRWGKLVWTGNNTTADWDGLSNQEAVFMSNSVAPTGTYFYVLELNDPNYPDPLVGYLYLYRKS